MNRWSNSRRVTQGGFTLIEAMLVVGIITVLATLAVPSVMGMLRRAELSGEARDLYTAFNEAKGRAKGAARKHCVVIDPAARTWTLKEDADETGGDCETTISTHRLRGSSIVFGPSAGYPAAFPGPYSTVPRSAWCACSGEGDACTETCKADDTAVVAFSADGNIVGNNSTASAVMATSVSLHDPTNLSTVFGVALIGPSGTIKLASAEVSP